MDTMTSSREEQQQRREDAERIRISTEMEGGRISDAAMADQDAYARGDIDEAELERRFRASYNLDD